jgi:mycothiol synthase
MHDAPPPDGFTVRAATPADADAVLRLINDSDMADLGHLDYTEEDLRDDWRNASLADDTRLVVAPDGSLAGYAWAIDRLNVRPSGASYTHPAMCGYGIGTWLTRWLEARARARLDRAPAGARVTLEFGAPAEKETARALLEREGFALTRYFLRMTIDLDGPPAPPVWPAGITMRTFERGRDDRATHAALEESFADHWGHIGRPFEDFERRALDAEGFDPSLWYLAMAGDEVAGITLCHDYPQFDLGWVGTVGVRRPWRRTGVALALLHHSFGEFYRRGRKRVSLGVDAQSLTGATRVYERAGMHVQHRNALYIKELRPGVEITTQELVGTQ